MAVNATRATPDTRSRRVRSAFASTSLSAVLAFSVLLCIFACQASASPLLNSPSTPASSQAALSSVLDIEPPSLTSLPVKRQDADGTESPPAPFDTGFGIANMTQTCATFFNTFLNDQQFIDCQPISLLLQNSAAFFQASKSTTSLQSVVQKSCAQQKTSCSRVMGSYAASLKDASHCGLDFQQSNPYVIKAYTGLLAYDTTFDATCRRSNGGYCFVDAMTDAQTPDSSYIYYLPLGVTLPNGSSPACNSCMQDTMNDWATSASNGTLPLSTSYNAAATQLDSTCGATFAKAAQPSKNAASPRAVPPFIWSLTLAGCLLLL